MENKNYISEGHYNDNNGNEYMSIWTYKIQNSITKGDNFEEAKAIICSDKFWGPFNVADRFKEGWMYNLNCLKDFYKNYI